MENKGFPRLRKRPPKQPAALLGPARAARTRLRLDLRGRSRASGIPGVHDLEQMRRILARERTECDQNGTTLSLLAFSVHEAAPAESLALLASVLSWRLTRTNMVGLLGAGVLGAVLPDTSIAAAHRTARAVLHAAADQREREFSYAVFVYPSHEFPAQDVDERDSKLDEPFQAFPMEPLFVVPPPKWKRLIDLAGAATGLVVLSPLLLAVSLAIKLGSPGPIVFLQQREGLGGRRFMILKFRTMYADAERQKADLYDLNEQDGPAFKIRNDPRITRLGRILRRTCIDELPQLWNVLKGDMSLVGPRPLPWDESRACARWQRRRLDVTPGLTCIWQVHGGLSVSFDEWMRMDIDYAENYTPWTDLKLILRTVWRIVRLRASH